MPNAREARNEFLGFAFGVVVGAAVVYFLTPRTGEQSRQQVNDKVDEVLDTVKKTYTDQSNNIKESIDSLRPAVNATADTLKAKIDETKGSITNQINKLSGKVDDSADRVAKTVDSVKSGDIFTYSYKQALQKS